MKTAVFAISAVIVMIVILFARSRLRRPEAGSFWDFVRNPDTLPNLEQINTNLDAEATRLSGSPDEIANLVDDFVFEEASYGDAWAMKRILAELGEEAYPRALEILRDPSLKDRLTRLTVSDDSLPEGPINRLCAIFDLNSPPPDDAAPLLEPFLQSESEEIRKSVAMIIGSIASVDSIPALQRALADEDEYVKSYALMGIQRAISGDRIEESSKAEFFTLVASMWPADTSFSICKNIPMILLKLNRDRASKYLLSDELFTIDFEPVWRILEALQAESVEVPRARLLALIADANRTPLEYPLDNVLEQALTLLGSHRNDEDLEMLERFLDHENDSVSSGAMEALYSFDQYQGMLRDPWKRVEQVGWDGLTLVEQQILAIRNLDAEVNNGGFAQYYFNSSGDRWQEAQNGLEAIGAMGRHRLMLATVEKFGPSKPSDDRRVRATQLSKIVRKKEDPFHEQDNAWYDMKQENLDRLIFKYNLANRVE